MGLGRHVAWSGIRGHSILRRRGRHVHQRASGGERRVLRSERPTNHRPAARRAVARRRLELEIENGSTRSSFNTTISVLEALLEYELAGGISAAVTEARLRGQEYLLERHLFRRLSTGDMIDRDRKSGAVFTRFAFPTWWHYDVLRGLDYLRKAGAKPDERVTEAIALVESKRDVEGRWPLEHQHAGTMAVEVDEGVGRPSRWNTLRALRVLDWDAA